MGCIVENAIPLSWENQNRKSNPKTGKCQNQAGGGSVTPGKRWRETRRGRRNWNPRQETKRGRSQAVACCRQHRRKIRLTRLWAKRRRKNAPRFFPNQMNTVQPGGNLKRLKGAPPRSGQTQASPGRVPKLSRSLKGSPSVPSPGNQKLPPWRLSEFLWPWGWRPGL